MKAIMDRTYAKLESIKDKEAYLIISGAAPTKNYMNTIVESFEKYIDWFENIELRGIIDGCGEMCIRDRSCDATEIERCVINLLGNAVKFTQEGRCV